MRYLLAALLLASSLTACGSSETDGLPACSDVWRDGNTLPADYTACADDGEAVKPTVYDCDDGSHYLGYKDQAYARKGEPITTTAGELARICQ